MVPRATALCALDQHGKSLSSEAFAGEIGRLREGGNSDIAFLIGGPDGLASGLIAKADLVLAFGQMTWPHQLVRPLLLEQLYRAMTIMTGHPYHRA